MYVKAMLCDIHCGFDAGAGFSFGGLKWDSVCFVQDGIAI